MLTNTVSDIDYHILSFLNAQDLCRSSQVNQLWHKRATDNCLWFKFIPLKQIPKNVQIKEHFNYQLIISFNALIRRVDEFSRQIANNKNGHFICHFPHDSKCFVIIKIKNKAIKEKNISKEHCFFMKTFEIKKPVKETITLSSDGNHVVHVRLPSDPELKNLADQIIDHLAKNMLNTHLKTFTLRNFQNRSGL